VTDKKLGLLLEKVHLYHDLIERIQHRGYPRPLLNILFENGIKSKATLAEKEKIAELQKETGSPPASETVEVYWDEEHNVHGFDVQRSNGGKDRRIKIDWNLIASGRISQPHSDLSRHSGDCASTVCPEREGQRGGHR